MGEAIPKTCPVCGRAIDPACVFAGVTDDGMLAFRETHNHGPGGWLVNGRHAHVAYHPSYVPKLIAKARAGELPYSEADIAELERARGRREEGR